MVEELDPYDEWDFEQMWEEYQYNLDMENAYLDMEPIDFGGEE